MRTADLALGGVILSGIALPGALISTCPIQNDNRSDQSKHARTEQVGTEYSRVDHTQLSTPTLPRRKLRQPARR